jgi:hypothetical protein
MADYMGLGVRPANAPPPLSGLRAWSHLDHARLAVWDWRGSITLAIQQGNTTWGGSEMVSVLI